MKPLKTLKAKKLSIKKETLRTLSDADLARAGGAMGTLNCYYMPSNNSNWCSSYPNLKCAA